MTWQSKSGAPPPGYRYGPRYRPSWENVLRGIIYILLARPRSLAHDALWAMTDMPLPPRARGLDHVPEKPPFVVVTNHYERPGLWMAWPALYVAQLIQERTGRDTHWIAIEEWESFSLWGVPIPTVVTRAVFERTFRTYGILAMPSPRASMTARAGSLRSAAHQVKEGHIVGLMPEGDVGPTPELLEAREGVGAFLLLLAGAGAPILPVGLYEEDEHLVAHFGAPFELAPPPELARADRDSWARQRVMHAIRDLLPRPLWGVYTEPQ
jgi:1-acyl-sn-glycerol-3-phosphate acyltransferase